MCTVALVYTECNRPSKRIELTAESWYIMDKVLQLFFVSCILGRHWALFPIFAPSVDQDSPNFQPDTIQRSKGKKQFFYYIYFIVFYI